MTKTTRPKENENSWLGNTVTHARLRVIDDTVEPARWKDVGSCIDTPNAIKTELEKKKYQGLSIWIFDTFGNKRYHGYIQ